MAPGEEDTHDDEHEEIEKQPLDLEDMLELFREPEEPPKPGMNPMWLVLILFILIGGCWLAVTGVQAFVKEMTELQGGTPKGGKSVERVAVAPVTDVVAAYRERCTKGMSKDEIRWIVEDYEKLGLDKGSHSSIISGDLARRVFVDEKPPEEGDFKILRTYTLELAKRQRDWLADALVEGLELDSAQKGELKAKMAAALAKDTERFNRHEQDYRRMMELRAKNEEPGEEKLREFGEDFVWAEPMDNIWAYSSITIPEFWLEDEAYAPWQLCTLSTDQLALTNHEQVKAQHGENAENWLKIGASLDPGGDESPLVHLWGQPASILPFTTAQLPPRNLYGEGVIEDDTLTAISRLNPAQFKLVLLFQPDLAKDLEPLLEKE